jgi:hypothetical protein
MPNTLVRSMRSISSIYPLYISADKRSVMRADGKPFLFNGDAGNSVSVMATKIDADRYLVDRAARGVTVIWLNMIEHRFSDNTPAWRNVNGDLPFSGTIGASVDFSTPVEAYWAHLDWIINRARDLGIVFISQPCYLGFGQGIEGWAADIAANSQANMSGYGTFIGNRYKDFLNIIWSMGGDSIDTSPTNISAKVDAVANAIKAADKNHLMTAHPSPFHSAFTDYGRSWLDINCSYPSDPNVHAKTRESWQEATMPTFMFEADYGNEHSMTLLQLRQEMWQGMLASGNGHVYGQDPQWYFGVNSGVSCNSSGFPDTTGLDWRLTMNSFASPYLPFVRRLQNSRPLHTMTPDFAHTVVTAGYDTGGVEGVTYVPVLASNRILIAWIGPGSASPITVDKTKFVSATFNFNWYNPRTGTSVSGGTVAMGSGTQVFTAPDTNDWVLLLDDQSLGLLIP